MEAVRPTTKRQDRNHIYHTDTIFHIFHFSSHRAESLHKVERTSANTKAVVVFEVAAKQCFRSKIAATGGDNSP